MRIIDPDDSCLCGSGLAWGACCSRQLPLTLRYVPVRLLCDSDPVRAGCDQGGHCCRSVHVPLTPFDVLRISLRTGLSTGHILADVVVINPDVGVEIDGSPECPFLDGNLCSIYTDRPDSCRMYPFWRVVTGSSEWLVERHTCEGCWQDCRTEQTTPGRLLEDAGLDAGRAAEELYQEAIRGLDRAGLGDEAVEEFMGRVYDIHSSSEEFELWPPPAGHEGLLGWFQDVVGLLREQAMTEAGMQAVGEPDIVL